VRYRAEHPAFPHDPTSDQLYDKDQFESYRQIGFHIGERLCRDVLTQLQPSPPEDLDALWRHEVPVDALAAALRPDRKTSPARPVFATREVLAPQASINPADLEDSLQSAFVTDGSIATGNLLEQPARHLVRRPR